MAAITLTALGNQLATNAAAVATAAAGGVTTAQITALANAVKLMDLEHGLAAPILLQLSGVDLNQLTTS